MNPISSISPAFGALSHAQRKRQSGQPYLIRQRDLNTARSAVSGLNARQGGNQLFADNLSVVWLEGQQQQKIQQSRVPLVSLSKDTLQQRLPL